MLAKVVFQGVKYVKLILFMKTIGDGDIFKAC